MLGAARGYRPKNLYTRLKSGRLIVRFTDHPNANRNGQVPWAHLVMETYLGRFIEKDFEVVHHCDENPSNDNIENLELMSISAHKTLHNLRRPRRPDGKFKKVSKMR
jgi:hypothetical protein